MDLRDRDLNKRYISSDISDNEISEKEEDKSDDDYEFSGNENESGDDYINEICEVNYDAGNLKEKTKKKEIFLRELKCEIPEFSIPVKKGIMTLFCDRVNFKKLWRIDQDFSMVSYIFYENVNGDFLYKFSAEYNNCEFNYKTSMNAINVICEKIHENIYNELLVKVIDNNLLFNRVYDLVENIFNENLLYQTLLNYQINTEKIKISHLCQKNLEKTLELLKKIESALDEKDLTENCEKFYELLPFVNEEELNSKEKITELTFIINNLNLIRKMCFIVYENRKEHNPMNNFYNELNSNILPLKKNSNEWNIILEYLKDSNANKNIKFIVEDILEVKRKGATKIDFQENSNSQLLWSNGLPVNCLAAILSENFQLPSINSPKSSNLGRGINF